MDPHNSHTVDRKNVPGLGSIYLRGARWHCEFWRDGRQYRESCKTTNEKKAVAHLRKRVDELAQDRYVPPRTDRLTVADLLALVVADYRSAGNRSAHTLAHRVKALTAALGALRATAITSRVVEEYKSKRLAAGRERATINRELAALRRAFRLASTMEPPLVNPARVPTIKLFREDNVRQGVLDPADYAALLPHLPAPIDDVVAFAYLSGWRRGEALGLTWREVDRAAGLITLPAERSKNREPRELPLSPALAALIEKRWQARLLDGPKVADLVFHRDGERVLDFRGAWRVAAAAIGKPGLLFHDLRRSAVTNMIRAGVPEQIAMRISGHRTASVFRRYRIVETRDLLSALRQTEAATLTSDPHKAAIHAAPAQKAPSARTARPAEA